MSETRVPSPLICPDEVMNSSAIPSKSDVEPKVRNWFGFGRAKVKEGARIETIDDVWNPLWNFAADSISDYTAIRGRRYQRTASTGSPGATSYFDGLSLPEHHQNRESRTVTRIAWEPMQTIGAVKLVPVPKLDRHQPKRLPRGRHLQAGVHQNAATSVIPGPPQLAFVGACFHHNANGRHLFVPIRELGGVVKNQYGEAGRGRAPLPRRGKVAGQDIGLAKIRSRAKKR